MQIPKILNLKTICMTTSKMMENGYYYAYDMQEQFSVDMKTTEVALKIAESFR